MPEAELFLLFVCPLNRAGIRYVISGSVAAIFYGEPRLTHDVDFVCFLRVKHSTELSCWIGSPAAGWKPSGEKSLHDPPGSSQCPVSQRQEFGGVVDARIRA